MALLNWSRRSLGHHLHWYTRLSAAPWAEVPAVLRLPAIRPWLISGAALAIIAVTSLIFVNRWMAERNHTQEVITSVYAALSQWNPAVDPLVTLPDGTQVKQSNVGGIEIDGVRYYYRLTYHHSGDPLSQGLIRSYRPVTVLDAGTLWEVLVYRIPDAAAVDAAALAAR